MNTYCNPKSGKINWFKWSCPAFKSLPSEIEAVASCPLQGLAVLRQNEDAKVMKKIWSGKTCYTCYIIDNEALNVLHFALQEVTTCYIIDSQVLKWRGQ